MIYIPIRKLAKKLGITRAKIYYKILKGELKEGEDWKEEIKQVKRIVVREDLTI